MNENIDMKIDKKQVKNLVQEKMKLGLTKQAIYEELHHEFNGGKIIADIVQSIPSAQALKRYKFIHVLFLVLLFVLITLLLLAQSYIGILWTAPMVYFAITRKARYYGWACVAGIYGLFPGILILKSIECSNTISFVLFLVIGIIIMLISIGIGFFGFYLRSKLTPSYTEKKELYINSEGLNRFRLIFEFKD